MKKYILFLILIAGCRGTMQAQDIQIGNIKVSPKEYNVYIAYLNSHSTWNSAEDVYGMQRDLYGNMAYYNSLLKARSIAERTAYEHNGPNVWQEYLIPDETPGENSFMKFHKEYLKKKKTKPCN